MVIRPGCTRRSESTYRCRSASRTTASPESSGVPANRDGSTRTRTAPIGAAPESTLTSPRAVNVSSDAEKRSKNAPRSSYGTHGVNSMKS